MITAIIAFIDAKYKGDFTALYFGSVVIDIMFFVALIEIFGK